jgi:hypothetical protein
LRAREGSTNAVSRPSTSVASPSAPNPAAASALPGTLDGLAELGAVTGQIGQQVQASAGCEGEYGRLILRQELGVEEVQGGPFGLYDAHIVVSHDIQEDEELAVQARRPGCARFALGQEVTFEIGDVLALVVVKEDKVLPAQVGHRPALSVGDIDLDQLQGDRNLMLEFTLARSCRVCLCIPDTQAQEAHDQEKGRLPHLTLRMRVTLAAAPVVLSSALISRV